MQRVHDALYLTGTERAGQRDRPQGSVMCIHKNRKESAGQPYASPCVPVPARMPALQLDHYDDHVMAAVCAAAVAMLPAGEHAADRGHGHGHGRPGRRGGGLLQASHQGQRHRQHQQRDEVAVVAMPLADLAILLRACGKLRHLDGELMERAEVRFRV